MVSRSIIFVLCLVLIADGSAQQAQRKDPSKKIEQPTPSKKPSKKKKNITVHPSGIDSSYAPRELEESSTDTRRGFLGVSIQSVDQTMAKAVGLATPQGVIIQQLVQNGAAKESGLQIGDILLEIDKNEIKDTEAFLDYMVRRHAGESITLKVFRNGQSFKKQVSLEPLDSAGRWSNAPSETIGRLGMRVRMLNALDAIRTSVDVDSLNVGVVVDSINHSSDAYRRGVRAGDWIFEADKVELIWPSDLRRIVRTHSAADAILLKIGRSTDQGLSKWFIAVELE